MKPILLAILAGLCWGVGEIFTKMALNTHKVGPMTVVLIRACVVLPPAVLAYLLAMHVWKTEPSNWKSAGLPVWFMLILGSGLMAGFLGVFFFYWGLGSPGGDISLLRPIAFGLAPATAVLLGWIMLGEAMTLRKALAVVLIITGIALLSSGHSHGKPQQTAQAPVE